MTDEVQQTADTGGSDGGQTAETSLLDTNPDDLGQDAASGGEQTKTEGEQKPEGEGKKDGESEGAPEKYEPFATPDGVELDAELTTQFETVARELNLSQANAQKLADMGVALQQKIQDQQLAQAQQINQEWITSAKKDPEIGGAKLGDTVRTAVLARDAYGSPAFKDMLTQTGLGNHPEMLRFLSKIGATLKQDNIHGGGASSQRSAAEILFDGK